MLRAVLIEENTAARAHLRGLLEAHPDVVLTGEANTVGRARSLLARGNYDLVFLDVQVRGLDAFSLVPLVLPPARLVFVASQAASAVRAYEVEALDYLLKPVSPERLAVCLARAARKTDPRACSAAHVPSVHDEQVRLSSDEAAQPVPVHRISAIVAEENYTVVWLRSGQRQLIRRTLKDWEHCLPPHDFIRAARDALVNLRELKRVERKGEKAALLWVSGSAEPVKASNRHAAIVRAAVARRRSVS